MERVKVWLPVLFVILAEPIEPIRTAASSAVPDLPPFPIPGLSASSHGRVGLLG